MKLGEFVERVCGKYGGKVRESKAGSLRLRGRAHVIRYLVRTDSDGKYHTLPIPPRMNEDTEVVDALLRSHCVQLGIDPADFIDEED